MGREGILVVISGFAGAGKGTIVRGLMEKYDDYVLSVSMTTRAPRPGEKDGESYFFVSKDDEIEWNMIYTAGYGEYWNNSSFNVEVIRGDNFSIELKEVTIY